MSNFLLWDTHDIKIYSRQVLRTGRVKRTVFKLLLINDD